MPDCIFCEIFKTNQEAILAQNDSFFLIRDKFPVTRGHSLIISKRHFETIFEMTPKEAKDLPDMLNQAKKMLDRDFHPDAYNVNSNNGKLAGQVIFHSHIHVVPRYADQGPEVAHTKVYDKLSGKLQAHESEMSLDEREKKKHAHLKTVNTGKKS